MKRIMSNSETTLREDMLLDIAKSCLAGILSGPFFATTIVNAMKANERTTLGHIVVGEAWAMAEVLLEKYEAMLPPTEVLPPAGEGTPA